MTVSVYVTKSAEKEMDKLQTKMLVRVISKIEALADDPMPSGVKHLSGHHGIYRIRVGLYRVIYEYNGDDRVDVFRVRHRGSAYEKIGDAVKRIH